MDKIKMSGLFGRFGDTPVDHMDAGPDSDEPFVVDLTGVSRINAQFVELTSDEQSAVERVKARLTDMRNSNGVYGKRGARVEGTLYDPEITHLPSGGKMVSGSTDALREYITRDIEATEELRKRAEVDQIITEGLRMQARGRAAPLPRPTMIAMCIRAVCDDIESWSK